MRKYLLLLGLHCLLPVFLFAQAETTEDISAKYEESFTKLIELHKQVRSLHPYLLKLYPVAVVEGEDFHVFDVKSTAKGYELVTTSQPAMIVPQGVRAAFPLDFYENKMACVVSGDVFDDLAGYVTIFHEFIHCAQMENGELELKSRLRVAQRAQSESDFMWELNHPFPYEDVEFVEVYSLFLEAAGAGDAAGVARCRAFLREMLNALDYEYMVWQEWKEGFARLIENRLRDKLELTPNRGSGSLPFNRVTFYEGGELYISLLFKQDEGLEDDLEILFQRMLTGQVG
jgi:hypothetical protein